MSLAQDLPQLEVLLLGPPVVTWKGLPFSIPRRQTRALLYYLTARPQLIPRETLCLLFWADSPTTLARRNLSHLLNNLRNILPNPSLLLTNEDHVGLDASHVHSDLLDFERLCTANASPAQTTRWLEQAVSLYRKPFLDGVVLPHAAEFEAWIRQQQQACERAYLAALAELVEVYAQRGEYPTAIQYAYRSLEVDELDEDMHRRLIELHSLNGNRLAALRQYERCITVLERELGVDPLPETTDVYRSVLDGRPPGGAIESRPVWTTLPSLVAPFVGRQEPQRLLEKAFARAQRGGGGVVWITGEPGIGKTRLMQEFADRHQTDACVLVGGANLDMQSHPYHPVVHALRPALRDEATRARIPPSWLAEAAGLLPELDVPMQSTGLLPSDEAQARPRLFEALRQVALALANGPRPLIYCLDDLQWCDHSTLEWLAYLAQSLSASPVLLVASCSSSEAGALEPLRRRLWRLGCLSEIHLTGLDVGETLHLFHHLGGPVTGASPTVERLQLVTGGNPFFILEILREAIESGQLLESLPDVDDFPLPNSVKQAVESHLEHLSPVASQVLQAVSVLLPPLNFECLVITTGRTEMEVVDSLDELVARQFLVKERPDGSILTQAEIHPHIQTHPYQFLHRIVKAVVYQGMSPWRRRMLHRRAARALEALQPDNLDALIWHYQRADQPGLAAWFALQAGDAAWRIFAYSEALDHYTTAMACLEAELPRLHSPEGIAANRRMAIQALDARCSLHRLRGAMSRFEEDLQNAIHIAQANHFEAAAASLRWREADSHRWFCRFDLARRAALEGVERCRLTGNPRSEALCWCELGMVSRAVGDYGRAEQAFEQALSEFIHLDDSADQVHALGNLSALHLMKGEAERAWELARRSLDLCDEAGLHYERRVPLGDLAAAVLELGDLDAAQALLDECIQLSRQVGDRSQEIFALGTMGRLMIRRGFPDQAGGWLDQALQLAEQVGATIETAGLLASKAEADWQAGQVEEARSRARQSIQTAERLGLALDPSCRRQLATILAD